MDNSIKFAELEREIRRIDVDADTIQVSYHLRNFATLFQRHITDDGTLSDLFGYLNRIALTDTKFAISMAVIFASHQLDDLVIKETKLRNAMLTILQQNFQNIEALKRDSIGKFYNSVTLLGEYYHRKKFANGKRILILGQSLLLLLTTELEKEIKMCEENESHTIDPEFAKVILSQVTLNGGEAKVEHTQEIEDLNYSIRKCLINVRGLCSRTKAYFLMALDLFYTNFNLGTKLLEKLYGKYLFDPDETISTNHSETVKKPDAKEDQTGTDKSSKKPEMNGTESNNVPNKTTEKTDSGKKMRGKSLPSKPRKKEDKIESPIVPVAKAPSIAPKKFSNMNNRPPLHNTSPKKDHRPKPASTQKTPPHRRSAPEKIKSASYDRTPPKTPTSTTSQARTKTPDNPTVLTQNFKGPTRNSTSPANNPSPQTNSVNRKLHVCTVAAQEDNVENLAWDDLTLEDESPQKINPHTKSFLNFLTQK
ncbi:uncharacterized protein LOC131694140 [Topomyia yanbarensis]|uniref:uncharacterized protein LOC131694140 n=1 Tax=Topomyia yanbarensis TaxID=2498891 RepID=UPI00273AC6A6|nr:uncharacterized protein LOC131694140 [Topomyia yanbarensis]